MSCRGCRGSMCLVSLAKTTSFYCHVGMWVVCGSWEQQLWGCVCGGVWYHPSVFQKIFWLQPCSDEVYYRDLCWCDELHGFSWDCLRKNAWANCPAIKTVWRSSQILGCRVCRFSVPVCVNVYITKCVSGRRQSIHMLMSLWAVRRSGREDTHGDRWVVVTCHLMDCLYWVL